VGDSSASLRLLRQSLPFLIVVIVAAALYDGWIFYGRWQENRDATNAERVREAQQDRRLLDQLGGDRLKILVFYASPRIIRLGQSASICYGVNAAKDVRIDPPVQKLHPAYSHCFEVTPRRDTEYRLTAVDTAGRTLSQSLMVRVSK
jgi:hypothetical protein